MTHFLYKPHIVGPENNITTPDIVIDRVTLRTRDERQCLPVHRLTTAVDLQAADGELSIVPAYTIVGSGGGALVGMAAVLQTDAQPMAIGDVLIGRSTWRLRNLIEHFELLELGISAGDDTLAVALSELTQPDEFMQGTESGELEMLRGVIGVITATMAKLSAKAGMNISLRLSDPVRRRRLAHKVSLVPVGDTRWDHWPMPRYAVGPAGDVENYI